MISCYVTPCVGVWIETYELRNTIDYGTVTPCVGVWIETTSLHGGTCCFPSHPAWVCGLKLAYQKIYYDFFVTPCVGVWIETVVNGRCYNFGGVTPCVGVWIETLSCHVNLNYLNVTPCVGVWIETPNAMISRGLNPVTPCVGVWIETDSVWSFDQLILSHPAWVCGLKPFVYDMISLRYGHTLRGCVD